MMSKNPLPLSMPSSTKTMVGLPSDEEVVTPVSYHAPPVSLHAPQPAQRTQLGAGPDQMDAIDAFLAPSQRGRVAMAPPAGSRAANKTLLGISEPPPSSAPASVAPLSLPQSFRPLSLCPASVAGPVSVAGPMSAPVTLASRATMPSIAELPYERPVLAAAGVATVVAVWGMMMLYLFAM